MINVLSGRRLAAVLLSAGIACFAHAATTATPKSDKLQEPAPVPAIGGIVKLFETYRVVGLSDLHANKELWEFVDRLLAADSFAAAVHNVTFECGNVRYQDLVDRYVSGAAIDDQQIREVWRNNTQSNITCDSPVYGNYLRTIRKLNQQRPKNRQLRVLLIDPPIDWSKITSRADFEKAADRDPHMAEVLEREVYAKGQKALFLVGGAHLARPQPHSQQADALDTVQAMPSPSATADVKPVQQALPPQLKQKADAGSEPVMASLPPGLIPGKAPAGAPMAPPVSPVAELERHHPGTTFVVGFYEGVGAQTQKFEEWAQKTPAPWFMKLKGTWVGSLTRESDDVMMTPSGPVKLPGHKLEDATEGLLYLVPRAQLTFVDPVPVACNDATWVATLNERKRILKVTDDMPFSVKSMCKHTGRVRYFAD